MTTARTVSVISVAALAYLIAVNPAAIMPQVAQLHAWLWPNKTPPTVTPAPKPQPEPEPEPPPPPPKPAPPPVVEPPKPEPPKPVPPVVVTPEPKPAPKPAAQPKPKPAAARRQDGCTPITVSCWQVCAFAGHSEAELESLRKQFGFCAPTAQQRAQGKACIRSHCPHKAWR